MSNQSTKPTFGEQGKRCSQCQRFLVHCNFPPDNRRKNGRGSKCRDCCKAILKARLENNPPELVIKSKFRCSKCATVKPRSSFGPIQKRTGKPHSWCKACIAKDQQARRIANPEKYRERNRLFIRKRIKLRREKLRRIKNQPCMDCRQSFPSYVMHFDHRDPGSKIREVALMVGSTWSWSKVIEEIAKCDLVCANCHAIRTHERKINARQPEN